MVGARQWLKWKNGNDWEDDDDDSDEEGGYSHKRGKEEEGKPLIFHNEFATSLNPQQVYTNNVLMLRTIVTKWIK